MTTQRLRPKRVGRLLQAALGPVVLQELQTFTPAVVSVTQIEVPADLRTARVFISVYGADDPERILAHLETRTGFFRKILASSVKLKYNPMLFFALDPSAEIDARIDRVLQSARAHERNASRSDRPKAR